MSPDRSMWFAAAALLAATVHGQDPATGTSAAGAKPGEKLDVAVLYAGEPDHPRTTDWKVFLEAHVRKVGVADIAHLKAADAEGFDVVVADTPPPFDGSGAYKARTVAKLPPDWDRATVALGYAAGSLLGDRKLKLDWL
ncbi:MAG: hypothetical protein HZB39_02395 [Planctomycetes bacterium]|nr:hypothetical protein [Planctomycetota bacterium]